MTHLLLSLFLAINCFAVENYIGKPCETGKVLLTSLSGSGFRCDDIGDSLVIVNDAMSFSSNVFVDGNLSPTDGMSPSHIDLSTVTTALAGKLSSTAGIAPVLVDLSTVTTAIAGKQASDADLDDLADGSLTASKIADGLGLSQIDETVFQQRVTGNCNGQVLVSLAQNGTPTCETDDTGGGATTVKLGSAIAIYGTAFADVTGLSFAVSANSTYTFIFHVMFQSTATTVGVALGVNGPANTQYTVGQTQIPISLVATTEGGYRAYNSGTASASVDTANASLMATVFGVLVTGGTSGTLIVRAGAETAIGRINILQGSTGGLSSY